MTLAAVFLWCIAADVAGAVAVGGLIRVIA